MYIVMNSKPKICVAEQAIRVYRLTEILIYILRVTSLGYYLLFTTPKVFMPHLASYVLMPPSLLKLYT